MGGWSPWENGTLLTDAISVARRVLKDLDVADTPAPLRRIKTSSARRLPPPLARSLLSQLDSDGWLRSKVADEGTWNIESENSVLAASSLFIERPDDWEARLATLADDHAASLEKSGNVDLQRRVESLVSELEAARSKLRSVAKSAQTAERELHMQLKQARKDAAAANEQRRSPAEATKQRVTELEEALAASEVVRHQLERRSLRLRSDLLKARRTRPGQAGQAGYSFGGQNPAGLARMIDDLAASARPDAVHAAASSNNESAFLLPQGIRPDDRTALDWLTDRDAAATVIVDGYNVTWQLDGPSFSTKEARQDLVTRLGQFRKRARGPVRIVVVFDSEFGTVQPVLGSAVDVVFVEWADEEVRRLAKATDGDVVVISSDREVQEGSRSDRVIVMWSEAFANWR